MTNPKRLFFVAGEHSGDLHGSLIISHLKRFDPTLRIEGIGGPLMQSVGCENLHCIDELAVIGFIEVLKNFRRLYDIFNDVRRHLEETRPDLLILIDYPGFNVRLAEAAKAMGIRVLYYICPQVWAWHASRVNKITRVINEAVVVFAFEEAIWKQAGATVSWHGHPLIDIVKASTDRQTFRAELSLGDGPVVSLLPGSREQEIHYILPLLLDTAALILKDRPSSRFLLPLAGTIDDGLIQPHLRNRSLPLQILRGRTYDAVASSDLALVASGTATLETAILGTPLIVVYQTNLFTSVLSKFLVQSPHIGLPNVVAGRQVVPEFIRWNFTPANVAREALSLLANPDRLQKMRAELGDVRRTLGQPGAGERVAEHIFRGLQKQGGPT
ncbi:MAG TPA: lipid-A-disaccharide synthase [Candidatus Ozemobacteraceae bacterium]|nr:lipid-A-disaccharide synthase [Candidatus Ozemobacteraceae bacterium]